MPTAAARRVGSVVCALTAVAILVGACTAGPADVAASPTASDSASDSASASGGGSASGGSAGGGSADGDSGSPATSSGEDGTASEILPESTPAPTSLGALTDGDPLTGPLPESGSAQGSLVDGFPVQIVPVLEGLEVVSSSVSAQGDRLQVGLEASTDASAEAVTEQYVAALTTQGFRPEPAPAVPGSTATAFLRGSDGLVLTVRARVGGGAELSIAGTLVTTS